MKKILLFICLFFAAQLARAQFPITMSGDPLVYTGWVTTTSGTGIGPVVDDADSAYTITSSVETEANCIYYDSAVNMSSYCQVTVNFDFQIVGTTGTPVADGMAFWFLSNPPTGIVAGNAIGLPNYANGLIMLLDTYDNNSTPDNPIETLLGYNGSVYQYVEDASTGVLGTSLHNQNYVDDGSWHHCKLVYNSGNINVYFNNSATSSLSGYYPLAFSGYFGFSGSTGLYYSTQRVKNVSITATGTGTVPAVTSPVNYCVGATADTLHATSTGGPLHWFTTDTATVVSLPGSPTPSTATVGTHTYYVRQGSGTCISSPDSVIVNVSAIPAPPTITGTTTYCAGTTAVPFSTTGTGILWYAADTGGVGSATAPTVPTATPGVYTYYASQTVSGCRGPRDSITVTVNAVPPAPTMTAGSLTYCQYATFIPFAVTGTNVLWYTTIGGTGSSTAPTVNTSITGSYDYYVTQTVAGCESLPLHLPVVVNAKPAAPVPASPGYCQYVSSVPITSTGAGLTWYGPGVTGGYATAPTPPTITPGVFTYYVTQTVLGCTSDSASSVVTVKAKPVPPATRDTSYCQFTTAAALTATGSNLTWYNTSTGGSALPAAPVPPTTIPGNTIWYVSQTVNGCESDRTPLDVATVVQPVFTITSAKTFVCQYDSLTLTYTGPLPITTYTWMLPAGASFANGSSNGNPSVMVKFDIANTHNYVYLTAGGPDGMCNTTDSTDIKVVPQPVGIPYTKQEACLGDTLGLALATESTNADNFTWSVDGNPLTASPDLTIFAADEHTGGPFKINWTTTGVHVIKVYAYSTEGCKSDPAYDTVKVLAYPDASFTYVPLNGTLCLEDSVVFKANDSNYNDMYSWAPAHYFNNNNQHTIWGKVEETKSEVTLTVTDAYGCRASTTMELNPSSCCVVNFPMAFSPNGDKHNDVFRPISGGFHRFHNMRIVNRWGQTVFESTNDVMEWDGTFGGVPQDIGVYYYYVKYDCGGENLEQKGDVTLVR